MAFSVKIRSVPRLETALWEINPVDWWDEDALRADARLRIAWVTAGYRDYIGVWTLEEAMAWHTSQLPRSQQFPYDYSEWRPIIAKKVEALNAGFAAAGSGDFFFVHVYEWESGLD